MERMGMKDDEAIEHRWVTASIENAQKKVEGHNFNMRKNLIEYDDVMNLQRKAVYELRRKALQGENIRSMMLDSIRLLVDDLIGEHLPPGQKSDEWDTEKLVTRAKDIFGVVWVESAATLREEARVDLAARLWKDAIAAYETKEREVGEELMRGAERRVLLQFADQFWKDHLLSMDRLRDGVSLRGYGQRNPLLEYKKEGFHTFQLMQSLRDEAVITRVLRMDRDYAELLVEGPAKAMAKRAASGDLERQLAQQRAREQAAAQAQPEFSPVSVQAPARPRLPEKGAEARLAAFQFGIRRNDPCPCGSGQKFKKCCYVEAEDPERAPGRGFAEIAAAAAAIGAVSAVSGEAVAAESSSATSPETTDGAPDSPEPDEPLADDAELANAGDSDFGAGWMPGDVDVLGTPGEYVMSGDAPSEEGSGERENDESGEDSSANLTADDAETTDEK
jgi:preprotein translocase subunit SecA